MNCEVLIDFLTFSVKKIEDPNAVIRDFLCMDPDLFTDPGYGLLGYSKSVFFGNIWVLYAGRDDTGLNVISDSMCGVCVSMSGEGCRTFESFSGWSESGCAFNRLFELIVAEPSCNVSRCDVACDDRSGILNMDTILSYTLENKIRSRMARRQIVSDFDGKSRCGTTVYIGAKLSDTRVRIYDKALEQDSDDGPWVRVELVLRGKNALSFVALASSGEIGYLTSQVLNDKLAFIENDDSNISRCSVASWWSEFISCLDSVHLVSRPSDLSPVEDAAEWVRLQVAPTLYVLQRTFGVSYVYDLIVQAADRITDQQQALIDDFWKRKEVFDRLLPNTKVLG